MAFSKLIEFRINNFKLKYLVKWKIYFSVLKIWKLKEIKDILNLQFWNTHIKYRRFWFYKILEKLKVIWKKFQLKKIYIKDNSKKLNNLIMVKFDTLAEYNVFNFSERLLTEQEVLLQVFSSFKIIA